MDCRALHLVGVERRNWMRPSCATARVGRGARGHLHVSYSRALLVTDLKGFYWGQFGLSNGGVCSCVESIPCPPTCVFRPSRVPSRPRYSKGRTDIAHLGPQTKIVWNKAQPPLSSKLHDFCTLMHVEPMEDGAYMLITRATEHPEVITIDGDVLKPRCSRSPLFDSLLSPSVRFPFLLCLAPRYAVVSSPLCSSFSRFRALGVDCLGRPSTAPVSIWSVGSQWTKCGVLESLPHLGQAALEIHGVVFGPFCLAAGVYSGSNHAVLGV